MSWKPVKLNLPLRQTRSLSPKKPTHLEPLRTSHQVRAAYLRRQDMISTPTGVFTFQRGRAQHDLPRTSTSSPQPSPDTPHYQPEQSPDIGSEPGWSSTFTDHLDLPTSDTVSKISKAQKQWIKWTSVIVPSPVQPYLRLLRITNSLRDLHHDQVIDCTCGRLNLRQMTVTCLHFDSAHIFILIYKVPINFCFPALKEETITTCQCSTAPQVLLARGFFPCTPVAPSLAVDIKLLEFARLQFLHLVPNTTGWCDATESFLNALSFKLTTRVCLKLLHVLMFH